MRDVFEKIDDFFTVEGLKSNWALLSVAAVFVLAVWLRYMPEQGLQYLQALDPYMIFRMSKHLALEGNLPALDFMRYFPYAQPVYRVQLGDVLFPAVFYWLGGFIFFPSYLEWAQFWPALAGGVGVVFMYLLGKEIWNRTAGVSAAFFLATIAGVMHRTSAGFFEKEPTGTMFMMVSLYCFTRAWKREEWLPGIASGLAFAAFTLSWGGSKMLWLLYPLVVGTVLLLDEDIEGLTRAYTPAVVIGGAAAALQPSRFWFTGSLFIANIGMVGLLWSRRFVEEFELVDSDYLPYYTPAVSITGAFLVALSPLYSDFLASRILAIMNKVTQGAGGDVIAGTVAENQAAGLGQLVSQLGALSASRVNPMLGYLSNIAGPWPLNFIAVAFIGTTISFMVARKYGLVEEEVETVNYYYAFSAVLLAWLLAFSFFFQASVLFAVAPALLMVVAGALFIYSMKEEFGKTRIEYNWYYFLPFFWIVTNVLAAVTKSRLVFLAAFPVAMGAGYTLSLAIKQVQELELGDIFRDVDASQARGALLVAVIVPVLLVNAASGYSSAESITGSPNSLWMDNLEYMSQETPGDSVILSWWDYGYWFESIGRRATVADGGNAGFYTNEKFGKVNYPIADFLTSSNPGNHTYLLRKHSVDYLVLDSSMVGKYSAVSQISNRDNSEFQSMITLGTQNMRGAISRSGNSTVGRFTGRGLTVYAPLSRSGNSVDISGAPTMQVRGQRRKLDCVLTDEGRKTFDTEIQSRYCLAEHPYYTVEKGLSRQGFPSRVVLVPKEIADSTLVRFYLMDGHGIEFAEKVPGGSNGYVKMWKIDTGR
ncbi:MAG: STT3 domain-containing protein [Candidatus Nanohaloarchaea archaeon]